MKRGKPGQTLPGLHIAQRERSVVNGTCLAYVLVGPLAFALGHSFGTLNTEQILLCLHLLFLSFKKILCLANLYIMETGP